VIDTTQPTPSAPRPLWTLIGPGLGAMLAAYQLGALFALSSTMQFHFGSSVIQGALVVIIDLVGLAGGFVLGYLLGPKAPTAVVAPALGLMLLGILGAALSGALLAEIVSALLTGLGGGVVLGAALKLAGQVGERKGQALLIFGIALFTGLLFGVLISSVLTAMASWRMAYLLMVPMALVALLATAVGGVVALTRR
jgi:MFS family permease